MHREWYSVFFFFTYESYKSPLLRHQLKLTHPVCRMRKKGHVHFITCLDHSHSECFGVSCYVLLADWSITIGKSSVTLTCIEGIRMIIAVSLSTSTHVVSLSGAALTYSHPVNIRAPSSLAIVAASSIICLLQNRMLCIVLLLLCSYTLYNVYGCT